MWYLTDIIPVTGNCLAWLNLIIQIELQSIYGLLLGMHRSSFKLHHPYFAITSNQSGVGADGSLQLAKRVCAINESTWPIWTTLSGAKGFKSGLELSSFNYYLWSLNSLGCGVWIQRDANPRIEKIEARWFTNSDSTESMSISMIWRNVERTRIRFYELNSYVQRFAD